MDCVLRKKNSMRWTEMKEWKTEYEYENANRVLLSHSCIVLDSIENYAHTHNVFIVFSLSPIPSNAKRIWEFLQMLSVIFVQSHWTFTKSHLMCIILSFSSIIICMNRIVRVCVCVNQPFISRDYSFSIIISFFSSVVRITAFIHTNHKYWQKNFFKITGQKHFIDNFGKHFF